MADTSLFGRLRRLFSTDVVMRNVGGNQLKVIDSNQILKCLPSCLVYIININPVSYTHLTLPTNREV